MCLVVLLPMSSGRTGHGAPVGLKRGLWGTAVHVGRVPGRAGDASWRRRAENRLTNLCFGGGFEQLAGVGECGGSDFFAREHAG